MAQIQNKGKGMKAKELKKVKKKVHSHKKEGVSLKDSLLLLQIRISKLEKDVESLKNGTLPEC